MKQKEILLCILILLGLFFLVGGYFINHYSHKRIKSCPIMYPYETISGPANPILIIENLKYKENLIEYYSISEKGGEAYIKFPLKSLPTYEEVYVIKYSTDSLLAKVVSYHDFGPYRGGRFTKGWVCAKYLHLHPPSEYCR